MKGKRVSNGRKFRNLENGKMYTTKRQSLSAKDRSEKALARLDCSLLMKATKANGTKKAIRKRVKGFKKFHIEHPGFFTENRIRMHRDDPTIKERAVFTRLHCVNGVQVVEYLECKREKSVGVQIGVAPHE